MALNSQKVILLAFLLMLLSSRIASAYYDEQLTYRPASGTWTSLAVNVTAVEQDDVGRTGPAYLLNGGSNLNYWYQVGLGWDWGVGGGFTIVVAVFDPTRNEVYGTINVPLSGTVNPGDTVTLTMFFSNGNVTMGAYDWNTGAHASYNFSAEGATQFNTQYNTTYLMTEQYHFSSPPYSGTEQSERYVFVSPGFSAASDKLEIWELNSSGPPTYHFSEWITPTNQPQYLNGGGAVLAATATGFTTGSYSLAVQAPSSSAQQINQGQVAVISSGAILNGTGPYTYQWYAEPSGYPSYIALPGTNSSSYAFNTNAGTSTGAYSFKVQVTDSPSSMQNSGTAISPDIMVSVNQAPPSSTTSLPTTSIASTSISSTSSTSTRATSSTSTSSIPSSSTSSTSVATTTAIPTSSAPTIPPTTFISTTSTMPVGSGAAISPNATTPQKTYASSQSAFIYAALLGISGLAIVAYTYYRSRKKSAGGRVPPPNGGIEAGGAESGKGQGKGTSFGPET